jgi:hypothetical protein
MRGPSQIIVFPTQDTNKMERRKFIKTLSWTMASGLIAGNRDLLKASPIPVLPGVPQPPGPPKPTSFQAAPGVPDYTHQSNNTVPFSVEVPSVPFNAPAGSWTLAVLPDTQSMAAFAPEEFTRQTEWIVAHRESHNIVFVVHEGDLVEVWNKPVMWINAQTSMRVLNKAGIPYCVLPGNHDLGGQDRRTMLNSYFTANDYRNSEAFGLFEQGKMENSWHEFTAPTGKHLLLALEFGPRNAVVDWANQVVEQRPDRKVIVVVHSHLCADSTRYDWKAKGASQIYNPYSYDIALNGDVNDGEDLWNKLLRKHHNIYMVLCGHELWTGTGYLISEGDHGQRVHQVLANYQLGVEPDRPYCGGAYLRLMQFHPDGSTIQVKSYSPWTNQWLTSKDQQFTITV